jgi:hypothetical protein
MSSGYDDTRAELKKMREEIEARGRKTKSNLDAFDALAADDLAAQTARFDERFDRLASRADGRMEKLRNELCEFIEQKTKRPKKIRAPSGKIYEILDD